MKYTNDIYNIIIIEIKEKDNTKNYLKLDDIIFIVNNENKLKNILMKLYI